jgi:RNA polymerase sigma factor (TIGR02999 family)
MEISFQLNERSSKEEPVRPRKGAREVAYNPVVPRAALSRSRPAPPAERAKPAAAVADGEVSLLLRRWSAGDAAAADNLFRLVDRELKAIARAAMRAERVGHTLQPTALVNELVLRLLSGAAVDWADRRHFFRLAAMAMRRLLVDSARRKLADRRGGGAAALTLTSFAELEPAAGPDPERSLDVDRALEKLAALDARQAQVVELRVFAGLGLEEIARVLEVSLSTVEREWRAAKAWLRRELRELQRSSGKR